MMCVEPREESTSINMVQRNNVTKGGNMEGAQGNSPMANHTIELKQGRVGLNEDQLSFTKAATSGEKDQTEAKMDPYMITSFLDTCMKLLESEGCPRYPRVDYQGCRIQ